MKKIAIIGAGISGLSIANLLTTNNKVVLFEADSRPGGLIKCDIVNGNLYHRIGGHIFNTKRDDVLSWFWSIFNKDTEFTKAKRNSYVNLDNDIWIPYPIENNVYLLSEEIQKSFINDLISLAKNSEKKLSNFEDFLKSRFGETLYNLYFKPYNLKVWRKDLSQVPLSWLEGKLPMPTIEDMIYFNMNRIEESSFVHSSFFYPKKGGSQFLVDRISEGLDIRTNTSIESLIHKNDHWIVNDESFDLVIYTGNIKKLPSLLENQLNLDDFKERIEKLEYHGTTSVFCELDNAPYSWIYMPSDKHESHRIIFTGNFSETNNHSNVLTGTVEFTDFISMDDIIKNLEEIPFNPKYLTHHYEKYTYPIQNSDTYQLVSDVKTKLINHNFYLTGRFAEWEYYNMDAAIGASIDLHTRLINENIIQ